MLGKHIQLWGYFIQMNSDENLLHRAHPPRCCPQEPEAKLSHRMSSPEKMECLSTPAKPAVNVCEQK